MQSTRGSEEVTRQIVEIIIDALRIDPQRVTMDARLFIDLEAESIDIVDIRFRLEELFGIKLKQGEMFERLGSGLSANQIADKFTVGSLVTFMTSRLTTLESG